MKGILMLAVFLVSTLAAAHEFKWAGIAWESREGGGLPGPNNWDSKNAWIDHRGWLHVAIKKTSKGWTCAQITSKSRMGFGKYSFEVEGPIDKIDPNVVFGMFMYPPSDVGGDGTNEIDIEFAKWGEKANDQINYTVWSRANNDKRYKTFRAKSSLKKGKFSFEWRPERVNFEFSEGSQKWEVKNNIADKAQNLVINFWLFKGLAPVNGQASEFVIKSFTYSR